MAFGSSWGITRSSIQQVAAARSTDAALKPPQLAESTFQVFDVSDAKIPSMRLLIFQVTPQQIPLPDHKSLLRTANPDLSPKHALYHRISHGEARSLTR